MNLTAQLYLDGTEHNVVGDTLAAFVGNQIRGLAYGFDLPNGKTYYFMTIYSNLVSGEMVTFKANLSSTALIHIGAERFTFVRNTSRGGYPDGFVMNITSDNDFPPVWAALPANSALTGHSFDTLNLNDYASSLDGDPIDLSAASSPNLTATVLNDSLLVVVATNPAWAGTDSVQVTATDLTPNSYSANCWAKYTKTADYPGPVFSAIPVQRAVGTGPFPAGELDDNLTYGGTCLEYEIELQIPSGTQVSPNWSPPTPGIGSMSLSLQAQFDRANIMGTGLVLAGFVGGHLAGTASPTMVGGVPYYFLTLANVGSGQILFRFYDSGRQFLHEKQSSQAFVPNGNAAFAIEFAPIAINLNTSSGAWSVTINNTAWYGSQPAIATATDCVWAFKTDSEPMTFERSLTALPVELVRFGAEAKPGGGVQLSWQTASEKNTASFSIERATDGVTFVEIGQTPGAGYSAHQLNYDYMDIKPEDGNNYYRLKINDLDGSHAYSNIVSVTLAGNFAAKLYPNPTQHSCFIAFGEDTKQSISATLYDSNGQECALEQSWTAGRMLRVTVLNGQTGVFWLKLTGEDGRVQFEKIVVQP
jgi:hypothetical protein